MFWHDDRVRDHCFLDVASSQGSIVGLPAYLAVSSYAYEKTHIVTPNLILKSSPKVMQIY
jgi:hypothetical protein